MKNFKTLFIAMVMTSSSYALADLNQGNVQFVGSISDTTCSFHAQQNGASGNVVKLGGYNLSLVNGTGFTGTTAKDFNLIATSAQGGACTVNGTSAEVLWVPTDGWNGKNHIENVEGTGYATNVGIQLLDKDDAVIGNSNKLIIYNNLTTDANKTILPFKAKIIKTSTTEATAGAISGEAIFTVTYK